MATEHDLVIPKLSFVLDGAHRTDPVDNKAVRFGCLLEPLLPAP